MNDNQDSYTSNYMISFDKAYELITLNASALKNEIVSLECACGRILAEEIISPISVPTFNNSAMDGCAVNANDLEYANQEKPVSLKLIGLTAAGDTMANPNNTAHCAWKIMTGAPVPDGFDSIIPVENTSLVETANESTVKCFSSPTKGAHIRSSGEDFQQGDVVLKRNISLNANRIMALASLGVAKVLVKKKPKIAVFSTGKELVDKLSASLKPGQIYNSNMPYILEFLKSSPVNVYNAGTNYDEVKLYQQALRKELDSGVDIIISTGAVSMGDFDFIPQTIIKMGGEIIFHKCKIRPGKPILFAKFPNGTFYFGLPGNPISATIGLRFFVTHLIGLMLDLPDEKSSKAVLSNHYAKKKGFRSILKANIEIDDDAKVQANIMQGQESFKIHPLIDSNGWVVLDELSETAEKDSLIEFYSSLRLD